MDCNSPNKETWHRIAICAPVLVWFAMATNGCKENSSITSRSDTSHADAGQLASADATGNRLLGADVDLEHSKEKQSVTGPEMPLAAPAGAVDPEEKPMRLFLDDGVASQQAEIQGEFTDEQLHKNFTLLMLAFEPDIRARALVKYLRVVLTEDQKEQALNMVLAEDHRFEKLKKRRAEILENALDGHNVEQELRNIKIQTVQTAQEIRLDVYNRLLTQQQKDELAAKKKIEAEANAVTPKPEPVESGGAVPDKQDSSHQ